MFGCHLIRAIVQANYRCVEIQICVHSSRIAQILGQTESCRKKHERSGENVVEFTVAIPIFPILKVPGTIVWLTSIRVLHDEFENVADDRGRRE